MKIVIKVPQNQEKAFLDAFYAYSKLNEDKSKNVELNVLAFIKNIYINMASVKQVEVLTKSKDTEIENVKPGVASEAEKVTVLLEADK